MLSIRRTTLLALALIASIGLAQQPMQARNNKRMVSPEAANANAKKLLAEIKWHDSLDTAMEAAKKDDKLVFYMHMLGKIDGDT